MKIFLSNIANQQLNDLAIYLEVKWSIRVRDNFLAKFDRSMNSIALMPLSYPASDKFSGLRKCVVTSQTSVFYRIHNDAVEIIFVVDNRQHFDG